MRGDVADTITLVESEVSTTLKVVRLAKLGARKLSRAHLSLARRPVVRSEAAGALEQLRAALSQQLAAEVTVNARLVESVVKPAGGLAKTSAFALLELAPLGAKALLEVDLPLLGALLDRLSGNAGRAVPVGRLTRIEEAAFGYLCLTAIAAARAHGAFAERWGPRLLSIHRERHEVFDRVDGQKPHIAVDVSVSVGAASGLARLLVPAQAVAMAIEAAAVEPTGELAPEVLAAEVPARALMGRTTLTMADLRQLATGDVVLFDDLAESETGLHGPGRLVSRTFELVGAFGPDGFQLTRAETRALPQESTMKPPHPDSEQLPVEVEIELTRVKLPISELASLRPGAVLPLHMNATQPVLLRVGDRAVAKAELVEIEGEVGARIICLLP